MADAVALAVHYVTREQAAARLAGPDHVLGVIGYGAGRPDALPPACPFIRAPLAPAAGEAALEIWTSVAPTRRVRIGPVAGTCGDTLAFGAVTLDEAGAASLEAAVEAAYLAIFDFLDGTGFAAPVRFWNYLAAITADDHGLQRYMRFNIGRHDAFAARLRQAVPPAASAVGGPSGHSIIYFLAARVAPTAIENPRQVSAYAYPPAYGPRSPSFSRACRLAPDALFISGTASITGHETRHPGALAAQIAETLENLRALIAAAGSGGSEPGAGWALKIYLRDPADRAQVDQALGASFGECQLLYIVAEICRPGLLLEIEAFRNPS